jgi:hypothetical protein
MRLKSGHHTLNVDTVRVRDAAAPAEAAGRRGGPGGAVSATGKPPRRARRGCGAARPTVWAARRATRQAEGLQKLLDGCDGDGGELDGKAQHTRPLVFVASWGLAPKYDI